jgi:glycosyltransferase involved in cell wall biosynthesis/GNAT superfamily N-acetyltransferase
VSVRVLWVIKGLGPGGAETLLAAAARAHDRTRFHIECAYVLPYKDHLVGRLEAAGVRVHCLSTGDRDLRWPVRLRSLIREGEWDVVHMHSPLPGSVARLAVRSMGADRPKLVCTEHNAWGTFSAPTRAVNRFTSRWDDAVFAVSDEARMSMRGSAAAKAVTLTHGIDVAHTRGLAGQRVAVRSELGIGADELVIGTVANFRLQKDYPNFLRAAQLLSDRDMAARFVIVGQGPLEQETRALARELQLGHKVIFTGSRPDAVRVMSAFDVFALASSWEGLPVALMEALAHGLPVVATAVGGVAEAMHDGDDALLVPPSNPVALADAWQRMITDGALRARLAGAATARADEFDVSRAQQEIERTYVRLAGAPADEPVEPAKPKRAKATGLDIRPATPDDREKILGLLQRSLGWDDDPRFTELYRWKHETNAFGPSPTWVAVDGERIAGVRIFMRWEFVRGGQVLRAVRAVDTATDPDYQGKGLFTALTMHALEEMKAGGADFVFNTPNDQSRPGYLKMGWSEVGRIPAAVRLAHPGSLTKLAKARVPSSHWSEPIAVGQPFLEWAEGRNLAANAEMPICTLVTNRSSDFYTWRFGLESLRYRVLENDCGAVVFRARTRGPALELVQVASFGLNRAEADRAAARAAKLVGADYVIRLGEPDLRAGFVPLPGGGPVLTWRALNESGMPPLSNWTLTMAEIELF